VSATELQLANRTY